MSKANFIDFVFESGEEQEASREAANWIIVALPSHERSYNKIRIAFALGYRAGAKKIREQKEVQKN